jgi:Tol biopolymer transport system component
VFRVSTARNTVQADGRSESPSLSADGRYAAYASLAQNLALPVSPFKEIFVKDRELDLTVNASRMADVVTPGGQSDCQNPALSGNGRIVAFESKARLVGVGAAQATFNIFVRNLDTDALIQLLPTWPNAHAQGVSLSDDGRYLAFQCGATNLPIATGGNVQIFVADLGAGYPPPLTLISRSTAGAGIACNNNCFLARISADGNVVSFASPSSNLDPASATPLIEIFVGFRSQAPCELVSRAALLGPRANDASFYSAISADGRHVAYATVATNLTPGAGAQSLILYDRNAQSTTLLAGDPFITNPPFPGIAQFDKVGISGDGGLVCYRATDGLIHVVASGGSNRIASQALGGQVANHTNTQFMLPDLSADGRWVMWAADSDNLVLDDTNATGDVFGFGLLR